MTTDDELIRKARTEHELVALTRQDQSRRIFAGFEELFGKPKYVADLFSIERERYIELKKKFGVDSK